MSEPRDRELEDHLAGRSGVSRLYRQVPADTPPPELDARIKAAARHELGSRRPRWLLPLSAAAVLMLSVGVLLRMQQEGVTPLPVEEAATTPAPAAASQAPAAMEAAPSDMPPAPSRRADEPAAEIPPPEDRQRFAQPFPAPGRDEAGTRRSAPETADDAAHERQAAPERAPEDWIGSIRRLRAAGRTAEAETELEAFRSRYPQYALPDDLR